MFPPPRNVRSTNLLVQPGSASKAGVLVVGGGARRSRTSTSSPPPKRNAAHYPSVVVASSNDHWPDAEFDFDFPEKPLDLKTLVLATEKRIPEPSEKTFPSSTSEDHLDLTKWGLPSNIVQAYARNGITRVFPWQAECLRQDRVLDGRNLVYSAPTSAGKTLVAEILLLKRVVETKKKGLFILPFVALAREKMLSLQRMFKSCKVRVDGYMGHLHPPGGMNQLDIAVCTIEKANSLINKMVDENTLDQLGAIIVDELHMVGDPHRGYLIELLLTKIRYLNKRRVEALKSEEDKLHSGIQIIGMSATLPNLPLIATWLDAALYITDYRPVPLQEFIQVEKSLFDKSFQKTREVPKFPEISNDPDHIGSLCFETVQGGHSVLVFCPTRNWCETIAQLVSTQFRLLSQTTREKFVQRDKVRDVMAQLKQTPAGLDHVLSKTVPNVVAYHHAGLTIDERDVLESAFRKCIIKVLVATTTLSCGVNLPARRVIIRSPLFGKTVIDPLTYNQMAGRAGRKGVDTIGESIIMVKQQEVPRVTGLFSAALQPVYSCLTPNTSDGKPVPNSTLLRAILEIVVNGSARTFDDIDQYIRSTLFSFDLADVVSALTEETLESLKSKELIDISENREVTPSQLGSAVVWSGLSPSEGGIVFRELEKARTQFNLENELHILYLVTPVYLIDHVKTTNWYHYLALWEKISPDWRRVGILVGVDENSLAAAVKGKMQNEDDPVIANTAASLRRFYCALILHELVNEVPLHIVALKYDCNKGTIQALQQGASTYAGMVTVFCQELGWSNMALLFDQFQSRLAFGAQRELIDLLRVQYLTARQARMLYNAGIRKLKKLAHSTVKDIQEIFRASIPFVSKSEEQLQVPKKRSMFVLNGVAGLTDEQAADIIVKEAAKLWSADQS